MRASIAAQTRNGAAPAARVLGDDQQAVDRQHRLAGAEGQALGHRAGGAQAGEGARAAAEGDRVEIGEADAGFARAGRGSPAAAPPRPCAALALRADQTPVARGQGDRHALGRGVEGEQRAMAMAARSCGGSSDEFSGAPGRADAMHPGHASPRLVPPRRAPCGPGAGRPRCRPGAPAPAARAGAPPRRRRRAACRPRSRRRSPAAACRARRWSRGSQEVGATTAARSPGRPTSRSTRRR